MIIINVSVFTIKKMSVLETPINQTCIVKPQPVPKSPTPAAYCDDYMKVTFIIHYINLILLNFLFWPKI